MNKKILIAVIIVVILIIGGIIFVKSRNTNKPAGSVIMPEANAPSAPSANIPSQPTKAFKMISIIGTNFSFSPNEITVKKGEEIKIIFTNNGSYPHNLVIDELNVRTQIISPGQKAELTFTPNKIGTFEYYCSVDSHREKGMFGKLMVE